MGSAASAQASLDEVPSGAAWVHMQWAYYCEEGRFIVLLAHNLLNGKKSVFINRKPIAKTGSNWLDEGCKIHFNIGTVKLSALVITDGDTFNYELMVNGKPYSEWYKDFRKRSQIWSVTLDNKPHACMVVLRPGFYLLFDWKPVVSQSEFTDEGSQHTFTSGTHTLSVALSVENATLSSKGDARSQAECSLLVDGLPYATASAIQKPAVS